MEAKKNKKVNGYVIGGILLVVAVVAVGIWWSSPKQKEARKMAADKKAAEAAAKGTGADPRKGKTNLANGPVAGSKMLITAQA